MLVGQIEVVNHSEKNEADSGLFLKILSLLPIHYLMDMVNKQCRISGNLLLLASYFYDCTTILFDIII